MDWQQLEDSFFKTAKRLISGVLRENSDQTFYAFALHEYYAELDGDITFPLIAMNSLETLPQEEDDGLSVKFNPADWQWIDLEVGTQELGRLWRQLDAEANRSSQVHWRRTEKKFLAIMVRVTKRLYREFKSHAQVTDDFVCFFAEDEYFEKSISKKLLQLHFAHILQAEEERNEVVGLSVSDRFERFREGLWEFEDELVEMGADAVEFALGELKSGNDPNTAARLLGRIGIADRHVIEALRHEVLMGSRPAAWCAQSLSILGDLDWLLAQTNLESTRKNAITGLTSPLTFWANRCGQSVPLNYRPLESLLEKRCAACDECAQKELKPGSSFIEITKVDVDEAVRGMQSDFVVIRQHAVCVAGERSLGKAAGKTLLPAIVERFQDDVPNVRRLAILALSYWKAAGRPFHDEARKLITDPDTDVRVYANSYFGGS
jgi:hypothetical protein